MLTLPIAHVPKQSWVHHINAHLSPGQSHALRSLTTALDGDLARLSNGRRVVNANDALKYLLEQIELKMSDDGHPQELTSS